MQTSSFHVFSLALMFMMIDVFFCMFSYVIVHFMNLSMK